MLVMSIAKGKCIFLLTLQKILEIRGQVIQFWKKTKQPRTVSALAFEKKNLNFQCCNRESHD